MQDWEYGVKRFLGLAKKPVHELKWKLQEQRFTAPLEDAEAAVAKVRKLAVFVQGGEYNDAVFVKQFGEQTFAYFIVRTDAKTEEEKLLFEGYMLQEEDYPLGVDVESSFAMVENLETMGYKQALQREVTLWTFKHLKFAVKVYNIEGFGSFLEIALPATKIAKQREHALNAMEEFLKKMNIKEDSIVPTDVTTLQFLSLMEQQEQQGQQPEEEQEQ